MRQLLLSFPLIVCGAVVAAQHPDDILGSWTPEERTSHVRIYRENQTYFGQIVWLKNDTNANGGPRTGANGEPLLNHVILRDFVFEDGEWTDGTVYDPRTGKTYYCTMELLSDDELKIRGSLDPMGWIGRTDVWIRHSD